MTAPFKPSPPILTQENAFRAFIRTFGLLERVMQPYFAQFGISGAQWGVLRQLYRAETEGLQSLRMTELSKRLLIRLPSATGVIDRLVRDGLVRRTSLPQDLRVKQISLTDKGRQRVLQVLQVHDQQIQKILGGLLPAEQNELHRLLNRLREHLELLLEQDSSGPAM